MLETKLIVGLGNPGKDYEFTRHNLGFLVVSALADRSGLRFKKCSFTKAMLAEGKVEDKKLSILMPLTFMNNSGAAVTKAVAHKNLSLEDVLVVCDDLNLDFGQMRLRTKGSDGGHNGLSSTIEHLANNEFPRLRLGIDAPKAGIDSAEYVLREFTRSEKKQLTTFVDAAVDCCILWLNDGITKAMDKYNRRMENGKE